MARINNLTNFLTDVATAIKTKKGDNTGIASANFDTEILALPTGIDTSDATATSDNIMRGYTAYVKNEKIFGNLETADKVYPDEETTVRYSNNHIRHSW